MYGDAVEQYETVAKIVELLDIDVTTSWGSALHMVVLKLVRWCHNPDQKDSAYDSIGYMQVACWCKEAMDAKRGPRQIMPPLRPKRKGKR